MATLATDKAFTLELGIIPLVLLISTASIPLIAAGDQSASLAARMTDAGWLTDAVSSHQ